MSHNPYEPVIPCTMDCSGGYEYVPVNQAPTQTPPKQEQKQATSQAGGTTAQVQQGGTSVLTPEQVLQLTEQLKPITMSNPVKVTQSSYLITEEQMQYLLSVASGNPQQPQMPQQMPSQAGIKVTPNGNAVNCYKPNVEIKKGNVVDTVLNATLGTVGRTVHTFTGLVDGLADVATLGYGQKLK